MGIVGIGCGTSSNWVWEGSTQLSGYERGGGGIMRGGRMFKMLRATWTWDNTRMVLAELREMNTVNLVFLTGHIVIFTS
jgi:hypothetical protein